MYIIWCYFWKTCYLNWKKTYHHFLACDVTTLLMAYVPVPQGKNNWAAISSADVKQIRRKIKQNCIAWTAPSVTMLPLRLRMKLLHLRLWLMSVQLILRWVQTTPMDPMTNVLFLMKSFRQTQNYMQIAYREVYQYLPLMLPCGLLMHTPNNTAWTWAPISAEIMMGKMQCHQANIRTKQGNKIFNAGFRM